MADDPTKDSQVGPGDKGDQGGVDPSKADPKDPGAGNGDKNGKGGEPKGNDFVTPSVLQGVMDAHKRTTTIEIKKLGEQNTELKTSIEALTKSLAEEKEVKGKKDGKEKDKDSEPAELVELRRTVAELQTKAKEADNRANLAEADRRESEFRTEVVNALIAAGCEMSDEAFLVIKPRLQHEKETGRIFATVKTDYGEEDLDLKKYIERHFREDVLPHVFKGKMRLGSPAGGDTGPGGSFKYTKEQVFDAELYAKDPEKMREAIEKGQVKGITRPGVASSN